MTSTLTAEPELVVAPDRCDSRVVVGNRATNRFFLLTDQQLDVLHALQAGRSPAQVARALNRGGAHRDKIPTSQIGDFAARLADARLLALPGAAPTLPRRRVELRWYPSRLGASLSFRLPGRAQQMLSARVLRLALNRYVVLAVSFWMAVVLVRHHDSSPLTGLAHAGWRQLVFFYGLVASGLLLHETAHAVAGASYGCPPSRAGLIFRYVLMPGAFVDSSGIWRLSWRRRVWVGAAGCWTTVLTAAMAIAVAPHAPHACAATLYYYADLSLWMAVFNLLPFNRGSDGFGIANDVLLTRDWRFALRQFWPRGRRELDALVRDVRALRWRREWLAMLLVAGQAWFVWWAVRHVLVGLLILGACPPWMLLLVMLTFQVSRSEVRRAGLATKTRRRWSRAEIGWTAVALAAVGALVAQGALVHRLAPTPWRVLAAETALAVVWVARVAMPNADRALAVVRRPLGALAAIAGGAVAYHLVHPYMAVPGATFQSVYFVAVALMSAIALSVHRVWSTSR